MFSILNQFLGIIPGGRPSAPPIVEFGEQEGTFFTWDVNVSAGTPIALEVRGSAGPLVETAPFTVEDSSDCSCL
ncbi:hypothetical protein ACEPAF_2197 [Sanghuangporus sanghuang]